MSASQNKPASADQQNSSSARREGPIGGARGDFTFATLMNEIVISKVLFLKIRYTAEVASSNERSRFESGKCPRSTKHYH
jgi:hypothetical protein